MVWFQCEDCGDNLKKPKLLNHFRFCSAFKLSCIDCGEVFGQHNVESHTQCITEAEKYGPKGEGKASNGVSTKPKDGKQKPDVDINVGLSDRPPWFCSLCNTKATSKQALLLHADGKKHRAKARAIHFAKQQPNDAKDTKDSAENNETLENKDPEESKDQNSSKILPLSGVENVVSKSNKKRKLEAFNNSDAQHKTKGDTSAELTNGGVINNKGAEVGTSKGMKKAKHSTTKEDAKLDSIPGNGNDLRKKEIKWKKLITSALKSNPDGVLKLKQLKKFVLKSLEESGVTEDKKQLSEILDQKIISSSRFTVDGKCVRLATGK